MQHDLMEHYMSMVKQTSVLDFFTQVYQMSSISLTVAYEPIERRMWPQVL